MYVKAETLIAMKPSLRAKAIRLLAKWNIKIK